MLGGGVETKRIDFTEIPVTESEVKKARERWHEANKSASEMAGKLFQLGSGYGAPEARAADEHQLQTLRDEAERLFKEYCDLDRRLIDHRMVEIQESQRKATWASFAVAFILGILVIVDFVSRIVD